MKKATPNILILVTRWLCVVPVLILAYIIAILIHDGSFATLDPSVPNEVLAGDNFAGHYILGPYFLIERQLAAMLIGVCLAVMTAPSKRRVVFFVLATLFIFLVMAGTVSVFYSSYYYLWGLEEYIRFFIEVAAQGVGLVAAWFVLHEYAEKNDFKF